MNHVTTVLILTLHWVRIGSFTKILLMKNVNRYYALQVGDLISSISLPIPLIFRPEQSAWCPFSISNGKLFEHHIILCQIRNSNVQVDNAAIGGA